MLFHSWDSMILPKGSNLSISAPGCTIQPAWELIRMFEIPAVTDEEGKPLTAHTTNPVPFILINADPAYRLREGGCLADIAPTLIDLMGMEQPKEMTGKSLLVR